MLMSCREVKVTESSESVLAGTKRPPFRLVVRAIRENGSRLPVRPAVSEEFVVRTCSAAQYTHYTLPYRLQAEFQSAKHLFTPVAVGRQSYLLTFILSAGCYQTDQKFEEAGDTKLGRSNCKVESCWQGDCQKAERVEGQRGRCTDRLGASFGTEQVCFCMACI